jgi:hypothetical protein
MLARRRVGPAPVTALPCRIDPRPFARLWNALPCAWRARAAGKRAGGLPACHHGRHEQAPRLRESPRLLRGQKASSTPADNGCSCGEGDYAYVLINKAPLVLAT